MNRPSIFKWILPLLWVISVSCSTKPDPRQLNLVLYGDPKSLDPAYATDVRTGQVCALMYDNLLRFGTGTELIPSLAKSWEVNPQGTEYRFILRQNVTFTDGKPLTSQDVKSSFEQIMSPRTKSHRTWLFQRVEGADAYMKGDAREITGFMAPDDSTFIIRLTEPFSPFPGFLAMPAASVIQMDEEGKPAGTGPWILTDWVHDGHLMFRRNDAYFDGPPLLEFLKIRILPEALPRSAEFITGYLDIMEIPEAEYPLWQEDKEWKDHIYLQDELNIYYIAMNCSRPPFDDVRVRQAMNYAVDVESILREINHGKGIPAAGPVPPPLLRDPGASPYGYNPEKARSMLAEAGYAGGLDVELWQGQSRDLMMLTEAIQSQLEQVGVRVKIVQNDWNMFTQAIRQGKPDMYYRSWWADYPDAENFLAPLFQSHVSMKRWNRYSNDELDGLISRLQQETDEDTRQSLATRANGLLHEEAPWIFLWHSQTATVVNPQLKGWSPSLMFNAEKYTKVGKR